MDVSQKVFGERTLEDVLKEVYEKQRKQGDRIKGEIDRISDMITNPGDAIALAPLLKGFVDSSLKNDETLLKVVQIFQKAEEPKGKDKASDPSILTQKDIDQLFSDIVTSEPKMIEGNGI